MKNKQILILLSILFLVPSLTFAADTDLDGIEDAIDNCPTLSNGPLTEDPLTGELLDDESQLDLDGDNIGDLCDVDRDGDGLTNAYEIEEHDTDPDDWDTDDDGVTDFFDCEPNDPTRSVGDSCDREIPSTASEPSRTPDPSGDDDEDGVINSEDNCPFVLNPNQNDIDEDEVGDLCDSLTSSTLPEPLLFDGGAGCSLIKTFRR